MKKIQVLMSTYNGETYLREQIDSILGQDCEEKGLAKLTLLIRDDGSKDNTRNILEEYVSQYPDKITWIQGENVGVIKSFFELMVLADQDADYYSFADQDDWWLPEKLSAGIEKIQEYPKEKPVLYCCRPQLVDQKLQKIESTIKRPPMRPAFGNALVENICTGCTAIMNQNLHHMLCNEFPTFTVMHDWWFYLTASCFGSVYYDETSYIYYRQHEGNVVGSNSGRLAELKERIGRFRKNRRNISTQVGEFVRIFGAYAKEGTSYEWMQLATKLVQARKDSSLRKEIARDERIYRQRKNDDRIFHWILKSGSY